MAMSPHAGTQCLENAPPVRFWSSMAVVSMWTITAALWSITQGLLTQARRAVAGTRTCTYPELHAVATCMQAASARLLRVRLAICIVSPLNQTTYYYTRKKKKRHNNTRESATGHKNAGTKFDRIPRSEFRLGPGASVRAP
ncbi:uncharacterized protein TRIVIDRAFT_63669 [Trichoderma virens Gv29-8]|uniref:Uncharacterized protein n=1 Tax=Hypocrea virens (strain Gv29-8 / FGSC 10586) TaxID=413071 RepID=G9MFQ1_HYPVG|nr:uncharacterized protein TRIVIDRAFT_63669 [Trichoderma virens Gv29-8]EHK26729.1 hypothetical protein TRIVIDRAFT_63669 [Trichoderma virens Gv29-8]